MSKYDDLIKKLKEIFQIDRPELDFGVYRIINARVGEINDYLENRLKARVGESLAASGAANAEGLQKELKEKEVQYRADGIDPDTVPRVRELRKKLSEYGAGTSEYENAVFTHLLTFFSRYYDKGDFISQRRYKGDAYAIPYAGEEVMLHWANKDQYYTKSGENFSNYGFKLPGDDNAGRTVRFRLVTADTAKDNRKDNDKERRFVLIEQHTRTLTDDEGDEYEEELLPVAEENGELVLRFEYKSMPKGSKQDALVLDAVKIILDTLAPAGRGQGEGAFDWHTALSKREPTEKNPQRTLLEKCLTNYTTRNTADYFIHKDLGRFLRGELDFYIKNEVMHLDDVQNAERFADIEKNLRLIQTLRTIALDLITFLAQLEDFQKKLWLKKKFVVSTHYCITLDRVPESLYPLIAANPQQWEQWENLGMLDAKQIPPSPPFSKGGANLDLPLNPQLEETAHTNSPPLKKGDLGGFGFVRNVEYLKAHPYLMTDTALFDAAFKHTLLAAVDNLDESLDGLLIHGDNFQALNLLQERYREQVKCVYIDPPYNTGADGFCYKDIYQHSSWLAMLENRIAASNYLMSGDDSFLAMSIDKRQMYDGKLLLDQILKNQAFVNAIVNVNNPKGRSDQKHLPTAHDNIILYATDGAISHGWSPSEKVLKRYRKQSEGKSYREIDLRKTGDNDRRIDRPKMFYPFYYNESSGELLPSKEIGNPGGWIEILPMKSSEEEGCWRWEYSTAKRNISRLVAKHMPTKKQWTIFENDFLGDDERVYPTSVWDEKGFNSERATELFINLGFEKEDFPRPKPLKLLEYLLEHLNRDGAFTLDYFAGSGTTGHAVINLNREDKGHRKYILVEQGDYFDTVLKPRIQKVVYSADWKDGKAFPSPQPSPQRGEGDRFNGISHAFKVLKIESYEDTLNNLQLRRTAQQQNLLDALPQSAKEDYLLRYLLDIESRGSLLSVEQFNKPFDCKLKVAVDSAGAYEERTIDLVETFNYLIGLRVKHIDMQQEQGFVSVTGWLPTGEKTLVLWRDVEQVDYEALNRLCDKLAINPADSEFEIVYINGDHNIPAVFTSTEAEGGITKTLKIRQIEPEFLSRMFAVEGV